MHSIVVELVRNSVFIEYSAPSTNQLLIDSIESRWQILFKFGSAVTVNDIELNR